MNFSGVHMDIDPNMDLRMKHEDPEEYVFEE